MDYSAVVKGFTLGRIKLSVIQLQADLERGQGLINPNGQSLVWKWVGHVPAQFWTLEISCSCSMYQSVTGFMEHQQQES